MNINTKIRKIRRYIGILNDTRWGSITPVTGIRKLDVPDYKVGQELPPASRFTPLAPDGIWGTGQDSHTWFRFHLDPVGPDTYLHINTERSGWDADNPQFMCYVNGKLRQGMDTNHREILLAPDTPADICLYAYTGPRIDRCRLTADVRRLDPDVNGLYFDLEYPWEMHRFLHPESDEFVKMIDYLYQAVGMLDLFDLNSPAYIESVRAARAFMAEEFYGKYCRQQSTTTVCIGHTHIDCAWLWTLQQTREKVQRSFATVLELMKRYPEYKFMSSQALLYKDLKEEAPDLYEEVRERIREGRWECEGAMWVEADCNLSSGESLVRQVLHGKKFFRDEFGVENRVLWLPDVFGYSAAMPQILKKSGVDWFVTSKISWNDDNTMPVDTFRWKGIDGTEINSYFLTAQDANRGDSGKGTTYVANTGSPMIAGAYKRYKQKDLNSEALLTFGFGDGGGGPTMEMLELARRGAEGVPGSPNVKIDFAGDFLKRLEAKIENNPLLPLWQGELYLEFHRGTYTSQARNKKGNRKSEFLLQKAELASAVGNALCGLPVPKQEIHDAWENVLTHQFHDIIPGSSIHEVYAESNEAYAAIARTGKGIIGRAETAVSKGFCWRRGWVVFNPTSFGGDKQVTIDGKCAIVSGVPQKGYLVTDTFKADNHITVDGNVVETDLFRVTFDDAWQITSIVDKRAGREVVKGGAANELRVYIDYPDTYDAWEWQAYSAAAENYRTVTDVQSAVVVDDGARKGIRIVRKFMNSTIEQTIWFYDTLGKIEFETNVDWHQRHQMLKAVFPVDVNADKATYEIQFGSLERPTHRNTSWDESKFEVCAHKYADLSEGGYGVSLINDCKYGHDIHEGVMQLSLLRGATYPDEEADQGEQSFTYALCPHTGSLADSDTVRLAYELNDPATAVRAAGRSTTLPMSYSAVSVDSDHVICETVKPSEYGDDTVIRMYECRNERVTATVKLGLPHAKVFLCDLSENELEELPVTDGAFTYRFGGFEIASFKIKA
ncbi:MAG: glycosyl hydrolase-related protein [Clostridia bacterium]|nr:glycosyl hydrolase-related protein [Clostridia bacterium]